MKFLCDRCKTRYSIGDDRVRGKILKIRCKNCNNVITVREGMPEVGAAEPAPEPRRQKQMTQAVTNEQLASGNGALGAAFASAMAKPPPALEEEWYVSIDGDQSGPFSLAEAQRWVAGKAHDAELHCWSEGFDDWLAVDKVSHFRGLRKKAVSPLVPPPLPRAATAGIRSVPRPGDDEPKPLFAATMASIEKSSPSLSAGGGIAIPSIVPGVSSSRGTPLGGQPAMPMATRANGSAATARAPMMQPVAAPSLIGRAPAVGPLFDLPAAESATQIETPAFDDAKRGAEPVAAAARAELPSTPARDPFAKAELFAKADPFGKPAHAPLDTTQQIGDLDDVDADLDIGEVSRVVNLADLKRPEPKVPSVAAQRSGQLALGRTGSVPSIPLGNRSGAAISIPGALGPDGLPLVPGEAALAPQVAVSHRRGMIALMVGALVLLGAAGAVVFVVMADNEHTSGGLGNKIDYDTTRPDDPRRSGSNGSAAAISDHTPTTNPFVPQKRPVRPVNPPPLIPTNPDAKPLRPDEIEEMASKNNGTTQRCYIRSQRGTEAILLADVKKLSVTLTVDKDGAVTSVGLSDHATSSLGKCLISTIRGWKFRASAQGITAKITMVFQSG